MQKNLYLIRLPKRRGSMQSSALLMFVLVGILYLYLNVHPALHQVGKGRSDIAVTLRQRGNTLVRWENERFARLFENEPRHTAIPLRTVAKQEEEGN